MKREVIEKWFEDNPVRIINPPIIHHESGEELTINAIDVMGIVGIFDYNDAHKLIWAFSEVHPKLRQHLLFKVESTNPEEIKNPKNFTPWCSIDGAEILINLVEEEKRKKQI